MISNITHTINQHLVFNLADDYVGGHMPDSNLSNFLFMRCRDDQSRISGRSPSIRIILIPRHEVNLRGYR